jgi:hypothetical protein
MTYNKKHTEDECDKCLAKVGKANLTKVPFLYLDKNDNIHKDLSPMLRAGGQKCDSGYRQYYVCNKCKK